MRSYLVEEYWYRTYPFIQDVSVCLTRHPRVGLMWDLACDGETESEIVVPLRIPTSSEPVGVLDLDSTVLDTFDDEDLRGLERIAEILGDACDWT